MVSQPRAYRSKKFQAGRSLLESDAGRNAAGKRTGWDGNTPIYREDDSIYFSLGPCNAQANSPQYLSDFCLEFGAFL